MADSVDLPIPAASFAQALSGKISGLNTPEITVIVCALHLRSTVGQEVVFHAELAVETTDGLPERWRWDLPLEEADLALPTQSLIATIRANLEEWWFAKDVEPRIARLGSRIQ